MGIQNWANFFGGSILLFLIIIFSSISTNVDAKSCCPWGTEAADCALKKWTLNCNQDKTICYDALTEPDAEMKYKPTSRFKAINANNAAGEVLCTVDLPEGMNISEYVLQIGEGYFLQDLAIKHLPPNVKILPKKYMAGKVKDCEKCDFSDWENAKLVDVCDSKIYCSGRILQAMNYHLFYGVLKEDSKNFVDSPLKKDEKEVLEEFNKQFPISMPIKDMDPKELEKFYKDYFESPDDKSVALKDRMKNPDEPILSEITTTQIVPVDLNAYICRNYLILGALYAELGNGAKANDYYQKYTDFTKKFKEVFLVEADAENKTGWYDYNLKTGKNNIRFYASMAVPLYTKCYEYGDLSRAPENEKRLKIENLLENVYQTFVSYGAFEKKNGTYFGIPTSMRESRQQWDAPNIWPPLVHMLIEGFRESKNEKMMGKAHQMAEDWVLANYKSYKIHCFKPMWEKLTTGGEPGEGGEYNVVDGFGWTIGATLDLLTTYNDEEIGKIEWNGGEIPCNKTEKQPKSWSFHKHLKTMG